jgi:holo-[acyl-carrier protein] synthase
MIIGVGIDTVQISRFAAVIERRPGMVTRLFTAGESHDQRGRRSMASLAARFAAKEAVAKALGAPGGLQWHDCEVVSDDSGRPALRLRGSVARAAESAGALQWHLSLTHDGDHAIAQVIAEGGP